MENDRECQTVLPSLMAAMMAEKVHCLIAWRLQRILVEGGLQLAVTGRIREGRKEGRKERRGGEGRGASIHPSIHPGGVREGGLMR